ncbi:unnamed protein product [Thelazia callipaeda]|uniref:Uncharacterized protein n=1 Tax=Thelazia callipaeda TaxID=103827 RepID=A0A0N5CNG0_THECL|nr:unnamed protein product [Thelazia callipaeda]
MTNKTRRSLINDGSSTVAKKLFYASYVYVRFSIWYRWHAPRVNLRRCPLDERTVQIGELNLSLSKQQGCPEQALWNALQAPNVNRNDLMKRDKAGPSELTYQSLLQACRQVPQFFNRLLPSVPDVHQTSVELLNFARKGIFVYKYTPKSEDNYNLSSLWIFNRRGKPKTEAQISSPPPMSIVGMTASSANNAEMRMKRWKNLY